jgi:ParB-like chromosome segregation protein Spo0J
MISPAMAQRIEHWPIDKLIPFANNPRTHSDGQVAQIAASIREFGFNNPILVDTRSGIIAGHGRVLAARKLGLAEVAIISTTFPRRRNVPTSLLTTNLH